MTSQTRIPVFVPHTEFIPTTVSLQAQYLIQAGGSGEDTHILLDFAHLSGYSPLCYPVKKFIPSSHRKTETTGFH